MSKITFRADSDLVEAVEALDASKSEVMRDALRTYLEGTTEVSLDPIEGVVSDGLNDVVDHRLGEPRSSTRDVNVRVVVESAGDRGVSETGETVARRTPASEPREPSAGRGGREQTCSQCGQSLSSDHVYCPNCGEKATNRVFCECGDEIRADWAFCPHCGRRTASADAFDR
jgi:RNA polymerase subunit RPABC4/transcription elongation factor Spt4